MLRQKKGFTLLELMTVMVIVAIVMFIAVPSYKTHLAKAKRKEGLNLLSDYFESAHMVYALYQIFPGNFVATGFQPEGELGYRVRIENNPNRIDGLPFDDPDCFATYALCACLSETNTCPRFKTWSEKPRGSRGVLGISTPDNGECGSLGMQGAEDTTFRVGVAGWVNTSSRTHDRIFMNERKVIEICEDGVN